MSLYSGKHVQSRGHVHQPALVGALLLMVVLQRSPRKNTAQLASDAHSDGRTKGQIRKPDRPLFVRCLFTIRGWLLAKTRPLVVSQSESNESLKRECGGFIRWWEENI